MSQGPCAPCLEEGVTRSTGLVIDGERVCATHAAKLREGAPFQPREEFTQPDWGIPDLQAAADPGSSVRPLQTLPDPVPLPMPGFPVCRWGCGKPRHKGLCKERRELLRRHQEKLHNEAAGVVETPAEETISAPPPPPPAPEPDPPLRGPVYVPLSTVPLRKGSPRRLDPLWGMLLSLPTDMAVKEVCSNPRAAEAYCARARKIAAQMPTRIQTRTLGNTAWVWRRKEVAS